MRALLSVKDLQKTFGQVVAARNINVDVPAGQTIGIIGANGAGKTTFVNMITGHLPPSSGSIEFEGRDIAGIGAKMERRLTRDGVNDTRQLCERRPRDGDPAARPDR